MKIELNRIYSSINKDTNSDWEWDDCEPDLSPEEQELYDYANAGEGFEPENLEELLDEMDW